jgi:endonuclease-3
MEKKSIDIDLMMAKIEKAVEKYPKAALFELAADGFNSAFELLVACIISIRTYDEVMLPTARKLFAHARAPEEFNRLAPQEIDKFIATSTFHERKAHQIHKISKRVVEQFNGQLPCDEATLLSFEGVGPKCANLVLGIACQQPRIGVDIHVHRVTNRWGYVRADTPEKTMAALEKRLPKKYWVEINRLLVPFGKNICAGALPRCSSCPVLDMCQQVGVDKHR